MKYVVVFIIEQTLLKTERSFFVVVGSYFPKSGKFYECLIEKLKKNNALISKRPFDISSKEKNVLR